MSGGEENGQVSSKRYHRVPRTIITRTGSAQGTFGWLYVGIPHGIILTFYGIAVAVITFVAFWIILVTGKYPRGLFDFVVGYIRWSTRLSVYLSLMRDEYPPFTAEE